jgi:hypothetical protein
MENQPHWPVKDAVNLIKTGQSNINLIKTGQSKMLLI